MNTIESTLREYAFELGLSVEDMRARVDEHCRNSFDGDWENSLRSKSIGIGGPVDSPPSVMVRWLQARGYTTAIGDVARWQTERKGAHWRVRRYVYDRVGILEAVPAVAMLWALALELDEDEATRTGEQVCRECSGRGERIVALDQGEIMDPRFFNSCRRNGWQFEESKRDRTVVRMRVRHGNPRPLGDHARFGPADTSYAENVFVPRTRIVVRPCICAPDPSWRVTEFEPLAEFKPQSRPETVSLEWLVRRLAAAGDFRAELASWPEQWQAQLDAWQATGETHWRAQWWLAFAEWAHAGKQPDLHRLSRLLDVRMAL